ncbi:MAG: response regulator transcription factor [Verrucomicrobia bacterium]|nr:response regulator transcription factor [Verrucomicrobiota bacterium]MBI3867554.1 response regulator transcription factor [Verrucomicrobiota bacterium]
MKTLRILIVDDHGMIRQGLRAVIQARSGWELCGEAENGRQAVELARRLRPDIVILDLTMPGLNGLDATRKIREALPRAQILIQTMHDSEALAREALAAGARGYLLKNDAPELLPLAIEALAAGRTFFTPIVSEIVMSGLGAAGRKPDAPRSRLTPRERELVCLLAEGKSNKEAADTLGITLNTVETHRKNVMSKLRLRSTSDLVRYAIREALIQP